MAQVSRTLRSRRMTDAREGASQRSQLLVGKAGALQRRRLQQRAAARPGLYVEAFVPYGTTLPISTSTQPSRSVCLNNQRHPGISRCVALSVEDSGLCCLGHRITRARNIPFV